MAYDTITLKIRETTIDGQVPTMVAVKVYPLATLTTRQKIIRDTGGNVVLSGHVVANASGDDTALLQITLPDPADTNLSPTGFGFEVQVQTNYFSHTERVAPDQVAALLVNGVLELNDFTDDDSQLVEFEATTFYATQGDLTAETTRAIAAEAAALASAAADATSKVGTETTRATAAEALKLAKASNLSDLASASTARTNLGLGTAATQASSAFDAAGAATAAQAAAIATAATDATNKVGTETNRATAAEAANTTAITALARVLAHRAEIDFTTKSDGAAPTVLDTGQSVNSTASGGTAGSLPVISSGALVWNGVNNGGGNAVTYFQADCSAETVPLTEVGCEFYFPSGTNDGVGVLAIALWDHAYLVAGTTTPSTRVHATIVPQADGVTATWAFYVGDGIVSSPTALFSVLGPQTFTPPTSFWDGSTRQNFQVDVNEKTGGATLILPGSQVYEVTQAQILAKVEVLNPGGSATFPTIANLGWKTAMVEHLATAPGVNTRLPKFTRMWAD